MSKRALITGISGQDGAYLSHLLLSKGYEVYGAFRRSASVNTGRLAELGVAKDVKMVEFDLLEMCNILRVVEQTKPDEIYNLAAQSFVATSFEQPIYTGSVDGIGVTRILEAVRTLGKGIRFYQASTSEMFGKVQAVPQSETTPFYPRSPYAAAKLYAHWMTVNYREAYDIHASSGILFNHESPLRGTEFVTRKITVALARIQCGEASELRLGNLAATRDWGFAGDYVEGMWRMVQQATGDDYVLATGVGYSVREFLSAAFDHVGLDWEEFVRFDPAYQRPAEVDSMIGDASLAKELLGWKPTVFMPELIRIMVDADVRQLEANPGVSGFAGPGRG